MMSKAAIRPLSVDDIKANLKTRVIGKEIIIYESISSTNDAAAEYAKNRKNNGLVIFAEEQTAGRGRSANKWFSNKYESILCSIVLTKSKLNSELLSLGCAVAVAEAIGTVGGKEAKIKWPNDIMINGKKAAGVLLESKPQGDNTTYIIGVGVNCHQGRNCWPDALKATATSIDIESKGVCDRTSLAKRLLNCLDYRLGAAEKNSKTVIEQWRRLSIQLGHRVKVVFNGKIFSGNCIGVDPEKGLIVQLDRGGVRMFDAADTSIVK
ncbi:MAG: biotin--[acetyl-CoA-carboxylase] ligase [Planctomycetota bacterium]|jgi:BirA family biotin operon repressor/biotin-[acetyl-CoA-carboxylase] ligase